MQTGDSSSHKRIKAQAAWRAEQCVVAQTRWSDTFFDRALGCFGHREHLVVSKVARKDGEPPLRSVSVLPYFRQTPLGASCHTFLVFIAVVSVANMPGSVYDA